MIQETSTLPTQKSAEISSLIETLNRTQKRLEELTSGEVDSVVDRDGHAFFLRRAQEELRLSESAKQAAILNALPAQIALLDGQGIIVSVNESWRRFATANVLQDPGFGVGQNYVEICERVIGDCSGEAQAAAKGIRQVLQGDEGEFSLEYPCHSPTEKRWFRLTVTPVNSDHLAGAVVMHVNITARKLAEEALSFSESRMALGQSIAHLGSWELELTNTDDVDANPLHWSDEMFRIAGHEPGEIVVTNELFFQMVPSDEHEKIRNAVARAIRERQPYSIIHRLIRPNGEKRIIHEEAQILFDEKTDLPWKIVGTAHDITEEKKAEQQLLSKTAVLEAQVNSTPDGILILDGEGSKILQNQRMIELWNIPQEFADDPVDKRQLEWVIQQVKYPREFAEKIDYLRAHPDEISRDELELVDGRFFDRYSSPVRGKDGTLYGRIWAIRDITERKQAAREMEELSRRTERQERLLSTALASMSDFAQIYDQEHRILFANQPLLDLWGLPLEDVIGKNFSELGYASELAVKLDRQLQQVFETGQTVTDETPYTNPTGITGYYEYIFAPVFSADNKVDLVVGSTRDVTQRKVAEVEIRFNEQRYRSLVEATTAIVWDTPASGEFTVEQPGWTAFTGQSFDELRGWGWLNAIHPEDRAETARVWSAAVASRSRYDVEHRLQIPDKTYRNMLVRAVPILREDGTIRQWIGIHTDITDRKNLEHQFLRAQRMESIGTLAGGVAHDLNNILAPILMSIQILKLSSRDSETAEILKTIETSAKRGADIVRQVLSFARGLESQKIEVQPKHLLEEVENIIRGTFSKNIRVEFSLAEDVWTIEGDPTQIHQILLNLCVNARDAMPIGGTLTVSVENCVLDENYSAMSLQAKPGRYVLITITDSGLGMSQRIIDKIFEPFFTTKELSKGTGLGLSTVMAIVKSHQGLINVYSELGRGTTFKVYLPAMENSSNTPVAAEITLLPRGNGQTVLVIDDEASILTITGQTLQAFGYKSLTAVDGAEGVAKYAQNVNEVAVVVTDMNMPIMNGMAAIRALLRINPMVKIIAASGLNVNGDAGKLAEMGVTYSLTKPYTAETLLTALNQILESPPNALVGGVPDIS